MDKISIVSELLRTESKETLDNILFDEICEDNEITEKEFKNIIINYKRKSAM